jgi:hypothetical protein
MHIEVESTSNHEQNRLIAAYLLYAVRLEEKSSDKVVLADRASTP